MSALVPDPLADEGGGQLLPPQDFGVHAHDKGILEYERLKMPMRPRSGRHQT
jgi:hypothetical protein